MESNLKLLPKRPYSLKPNSFPTKIKLLTNHYYFSLKNSANLYQFSIDSQPHINDDSIDVLRELGNSMRQALMSQIGFICHKGKTIWGIKPLQKPLILNRTIKENTYQVIIKQSRVFNESDILRLQGVDLRRVLQVYSVAMKEKLVKMGLKEITKGRYFRIKPMQRQEMQFDEIQLKAFRTYSLRLVPLMNSLSLQIDVGTRVLRAENFLQTLNSCTSVSEKRLLIGQIVQCNYGNRNSYKIIDIDFSKSPLSLFHQEKIQAQITYQKYYYQQYKIKIRQTKQPLLKVVLRVEQVIKEGKTLKKPIQVYLIPELVRLVGIPQECLKDKFIMRQLADFTKMTPSKRNQYSQDIVYEFNQQKGYMSIQNQIQVDGFILPSPTVLTSHERTAQNGSIIIKDKLKEPMKLMKERWLFTFSAYSKNNIDTEEAKDIVEGFRQAQNVFGINIEDPKFVKIYKDNVEEWKKEISKNFDNHAIVVLFLTNRQARYYDQLKKFLVNQLTVPSQVVLRKQLKSKGALSIFSNIIKQMNAKIGKSLWSIIPKHPFWKQKTIVMGGLSLSKAKNSHTLAFVGTYSRDLTKTYSNCLTKLPSREQISDKIYEDLFVDWIKKFNELEKVMPSIIILYRQGLSEQQVKVQGQKQLQAINRVIARANKKFTDYNPQIIYIVVNKGVNCKFYSIEKKNENGGKFRPFIDNPSSGTVIFEPLSTENAYDFHLAAQKVTQGTCTPTHYRICYDSSKIPQQAIAQLTYQQCFNYYNWSGAVRVPSCLQNADKLSRLVGEHIKENIVGSSLLRTPFYL